MKNFWHDDSHIISTTRNWDEIIECLNIDFQINFIEIVYMIICCYFSLAHFFSSNRNAFMKFWDNFDAAEFILVIQRNEILNDVLLVIVLQVFRYIHINMSKICDVIRAHMLRIIWIWYQSWISIRSQTGIQSSVF
jgi:hypothetical protein